MAKDRGGGEAFAPIEIKLRIEARAEGTATERPFLRLPARINNEPPLCIGWLDLNEYDKRMDETSAAILARPTELKNAGVPIAEQRRIIFKAFTGPILNSRFRDRVARCGLEIRNRLLGQVDIVVPIDRFRSWLVDERNCSRFAEYKERFHRLWKKARRIQGSIPDSEEARRKILDECGLLPPDLLDCLFEKKARTFKYAACRIAIVHAARAAGYRDAKISDWRKLYYLLREQPVRKTVAIAVKEEDRRWGE